MSSASNRRRLAGVGIAVAVCTATSQAQPAHATVGPGVGATTLRLGIVSPSHIVTGPDGNLWFTERRAIGRMTRRGVLRNFVSPAITAPEEHHRRPGRGALVHRQQPDRTHDDRGSRHHLHRERR